VDMFHRASWDLKEVCDRSIPQLEQGSKRPCGGKVCSPAVFSVSGLTFLDSPPGGGGLTPPYPTQFFQTSIRFLRLFIFVYKSNNITTVPLKQ